MRIKTSAVFGNLNSPVDLPKLTGLENFRLVRSGYLKLGNATACIYKSGKVQIYGLKDVSVIQDVWNDFLKQIESRTDISQADSAPFVKYITQRNPSALFRTYQCRLYGKQKKEQLLCAGAELLSLTGLIRWKKQSGRFYR
jgi:hypothetical protein